MKKHSSIPRNDFEKLRMELNLTQENFGKKLGLSKSVVHQYESGRSSPTKNSWLRMKESAVLNGIELSDDLYNSLMKDKSDRMINSIQDKVQRIVDKASKLNNVGSIS